MTHSWGVFLGGNHNGMQVTAYQFTLQRINGIKLTVNDLLVASIVIKSVH